MLGFKMDTLPLALPQPAIVPTYRTGLGPIHVNHCNPLTGTKKMARAFLHDPPSKSRPNLTALAPED